MIKSLGRPRSDFPSREYFCSPRERGKGAAGPHHCLCFCKELKGSVDEFQKQLPLAVWFPCEFIKCEHFYI